MYDQEREAALKLPLFAGLPSTLTDVLLNAATVETLSAGDCLFKEGSEASHVHVMMSGIVEISCGESGSECAIMLLTTGDIFMPVAALFDAPYLTTATALSRVQVLVLDGTRLREEALKSAVLAMRIAQLIGGQWRMAVRHIVDLKCRSAPQRLASFLLRLADQGTYGVTPLPISKQKLAARVGMTAETLSRSLQLLAENGLHLRGARIIVHDRSRIDQFCGPDPYSQRDEVALGVHAL